MLKTKTFLLIIYSFILASGIAQTGNILNIIDHKDSYSIYNITYVYLDHSRKLTIKDVTSSDFRLPASGLFKPNPTKDLNFGFTNDNLWLNFKVINQTDQTLAMVLSLENPDINHINYYEFIDGKLSDSLITGEREKFNSRRVYDRKFIFQIKLEPHKVNEYFIKANNDGDVLFIPVHIEPFRYFETTEINQNLFIGIIFGLFIFIFLFNFFLFITINERIYLYYALYVFFLAIVSFNIEGYSFQYFWPNIPKLTDILTAFSLSLSVFFLYEFSRIFLKLKEWFPTLNIIFRFLGAIYGILAIMSLFDYPTLILTFEIIVVLNFLTVAIIIFASILTLKKKFIPAYYFIAAFICISLAVILFGLRSLGFIPQSIFSINIFNIGIVSQSLLLSFAVLDRFRRMSKEANTLLENQKREIEIQRDKAQESDRLKSAFLSNISHEIRTPMNSVVGFAGFMTDPDISDEQKQTFIKLINNNCKILLRLIDDILDLAKIETGDLLIVESECRINNLLDEMNNGFIEERNRLEKNNIDIFLRKDIKADDFTIITDCIRLQQILSNLMQNAIKFTDNGSIVYGYEIKNEKEIEFYINDTGKGLAKDKIQLIFEKFNKLNHDKSKIYSGIGMGLAISKNLVMLLGGKIFFDSELDRGTNVKFTLPLKTLKSLDEYKQLPNKNITEDIWIGKNILIVEDEDDNYLLMKGMLRNTGAKLLWAKNGKKAVEIIRTNDIKLDLVLMDLRMPVVDGYEATRRIKQINDKIIVIAITALAFADERELSMQAGCDAYLSKPINKNKLLEMINSYFFDNKSIKEE